MTTVGSLQICTPVISRGSQNKVQEQVNTPLKSGQKKYKAHLIPQHIPEHLPIELDLGVDTYCRDMALFLSIGDR